jgi:hypothetical protein
VGRVPGGAEAAVLRPGERVCVAGTSARPYAPDTVAARVERTGTLVLERELAPLHVSCWQLPGG